MGELETIQLTAVTRTLTGGKPEFPPQPRDRGLLIELSGNMTGRVHGLTQSETTLGRGEACVISFDDATLSRNHAGITRQVGQFVFEDSGSLNGSYINQTRTSTHIMAHGDRIRLGSGVHLLFQLVDADAEQVLVHLYQFAVRDGLTGVHNRRWLQERLTAEVAHARRHKREFSAILLDLDHFKVVNDSHGHLAGDEVLKATAKAMAANVRTEDLVARYGGEEFVVLARDSGLDAALVLAERIRSCIAALEVPFEGLILKVTASIGIACLGQLGPDACGPDLLERADQAMYKAKSSGRNRVVVYQG